MVDEKVASQSQVCACPDTFAGWLKIPWRSPALTQIQTTIAIETCLESVSGKGPLKDYLLE